MRSRAMLSIPYATEAIIILLPFFVYLSTACPTVYPGDSGELTAAACSLGIPHNSGYPLYALLGKVFCLIPFGSIGFRMNLMSSMFAVLAVWLVYSIILKITSSRLSAFAGALFLAFTPVLWSQTVSAEVYTLHTFFVALLMRLLWWWDEKKTLSSLAIFVFITGLSFGNHMQTVMLAPPTLLIVLSANCKELAKLKNFLLLFVVFLFALSAYLYLPIRTEAGAAIHWGDPNTLNRFLAHVTASAHREGYVLTKTLSEYISRTREALSFLGNQVGAVLLLATWGWFKLTSVRWRIFFLTVIVFDLFYTVFLNIVSLEITAFELPTCTALAILVGVGMANILGLSKDYPTVGNTGYRTVQVTCCLLPLIPLGFNFDLCDQNRNYTGYEHTVNIFRSADYQSTLFLDGDNNIFPVTYGRICERMREDVRLYDRHNIIFKMPYPDNYPNHFYGKWTEFRPVVEKDIIKKAQNGVYYAVFDPFAFSTPEHYTLYPHGILYKVVQRETPFPDNVGNTVWSYYITESIYDHFHKDFMNRNVCAYFHFNLGKYLFTIGQPDLGLRSMKTASRVGYNDTMIHSDIAVFLTDHGLFEEARLELEKALAYHVDLSGVYNNWGYYYQKTGHYDEAAVSFRNAIALNPKYYAYYNNLGSAFYKSGKKEKAMAAFQKSLAIKKNQPKLKRFLQEYGL